MTIGPKIKHLVAIDGDLVTTEYHEQIMIMTIDKAGMKLIAFQEI